YEKNDGPVFQGMSYGQKTKDYSESKAQEIDAEISRIINEGYKKAMDIIVGHKAELEKITLALLEYETIDGHEVEILIKGAAVSEIQKLRINRKSGGMDSITSNEKLSDQLADQASDQATVTDRKPAPVT
ncbi:MAG: cell division protein FtsH, partial [Bdellovibrionota bacterium]